MMKTKKYTNLELLSTVLSVRSLCTARNSHLLGSIVKAKNMFSFPVFITKLKKFKVTKKDKILASCSHCRFR